MIIEEDGSIQHMKLFRSPAKIPKDSGVSVNTLVDGPLDLVDFTSEDGRNSGHFGDDVGAADSEYLRGDAKTDPFDVRQCDVGKFYYWQSFAIEEKLGG